MTYLADGGGFESDWGAVFAAEAPAPDEEVDDETDEGDKRAAEDSKNGYRERVEEPAIAQGRTWVCDERLWAQRSIRRCCIRVRTDDNRKRTERCTLQKHGRS